MMGVMLGMIIGPAIGGLLGAINWRYPAYLAVVLAFISFSLTYKILVETMPKERIADIKKAMKEKKSKSILWTKNFKVRLMQIFLMNFAFIAITTSLPLVLAKKFAAGPLEIGALMSFNGIMMVLTMGIAVKKFGDKYSRQGMVTFSVLLMLIAYLMYSFLSAYWMFFIFLGILTVGNALARPITQTNLLKSAPPDQQGAASGWGTNIQSVAESTAPLIATWYLEIGSIALGTLTLSAYVLIGITTFITISIFALIISWDFKANKADF
jgi:MFS transporter, DHA1 family, tetracycline resistance protein